MYKDWDEANKLTQFEYEVSYHFNANRHRGKPALLVTVGTWNRYSVVTPGHDPHSAIETIELSRTPDYMPDIPAPKVVLALDLLSPKKFEQQIPWRLGTVHSPMDLYAAPLILLPPKDGLLPALRHDSSGNATTRAPGFIRGVILGNGE